MSTRLEWQTSKTQTAARRGLLTVGLFIVFVLFVYLAQQGRGLTRNYSLSAPPGFQL